MRIATLLFVALASFGPLCQSNAATATPALNHVSVPLADGRILQLGADGASGEQASREVRKSWSSNAQVRSEPAGQLQQARVWHSVTALPDGRVLIVGGEDETGALQGSAEIFDPASGQSALLDVNLLARTKHTATVLLDGRVLIVGGLDARNQAIATAEIWNSASGRVETLNSRLEIARFLHAAEWTSGEEVLIQGGLDERSNQVIQAERYLPLDQRFELKPATGPKQLKGAPVIVDGIPQADARDVPIDAILSLRFDRPLAIDTVSTKTVTLLGPTGRVKIKVAAVERGRLLFVTPSIQLQPGAAYTLFVHGAKDAQGVALPFSARGFRTARLDAPSSERGNMDVGAQPLSPAPAVASPAADKERAASQDDLADDEMWRPGPHNFRGDWRSRAAPLAKRSSSSHGNKTQSRGDAKTSTGVSGQVLRLNGRPLAKVSIAVGERKTFTDDKGEFLLTEIPAGKQVLVIDGSTANHGGKHYGRYEYKLHATAGSITALPFTIWMSRLDTANAVSLASPTAGETVVTNAHIPGLELRIPAGTVIRDTKGRIVTELTLTPIPVDQPPFPLPELPVPVYFTIQPGGAHLQNISADGPRGARLIYPNFTSSAPGTRIDFWNYDARERGWFVYGQGTVTPDGKQVMPDPGVVIHEFTGAMIAIPSSAPPEGPPPDGCKDLDPVDCYTGLFIHERVDLSVNDVIPLEVRRTYRQRDSISRAFGIGTNLGYDVFLIGDTFPYTYQELILADGGRIRYNRTSPGTSFEDAVYMYRGVSARYNGSTLRWSGNGWFLDMKDGSRLIFADSYLTANARVAAPIGMRDRHGNIVTFERDASANLTRVTSPNGRNLYFTYVANRVSQVRDDAGRVVTYDYDGQGRLWKVTDPENGVEEYTYDSNHAMLTVKDARQNIMVINRYDANGRVDKQTYPDGRTAFLAYTTDASGRVTQTDVTDERGTIKRMVFNDRGYPLRVVDGLGTPQQREFLYERDPVSSLVTLETDPLGRKTRFEYDSAGNVTKVNRLADTSQAVNWTFTYDAQYQLIDVVTDPLGRTVDHDYDGFGNLVRVRNHLGHGIALTYNAAGQLETMTRTAGGQTIESRMSYVGGDLVESNHAGRVTRFAHDAVGRVVGWTDGNNNLSLFQYDDLDRLVQRCNAAQECATFSYDENGNLRRFERGASRRDYSYDSRNRMQTEGRADQTEISYTYEPGGFVKTRTEASGRRVVHTYDPLGRVSQSQYELNSVPTRTATFGWDAADRLLSLNDSVAGALSYQYDNRFDAVTREDGPTGRVSYTYYKNGQRESMTPRNGTKLSYGYDAANRLISITQAAGSGNARPSSAKTVAFDYDEAGRSSRLTLANGITVDYGWNEHAELAGLTYRLADGTLIGDLTYDYDDAGQRVGVDGSLFREARPSARELPTDATGRLASDNGSLIVWDANGRLLRDASKTYAWNDLGQLAEIRETASGALLASFQYDPLGRRMQRTVGTTVTRYLHDGINPIQLQSATGSAQENLLAGGVDEWFARTRGGSTAHFLTDALGSTIRLTNSSGAKINDYTYDAYGGTSNDKTSEKNPFQFTGRENDGTGLYYYRARYYMPKWARFISQDPIGLEGGPNLYLYVDGNPVSYTDPTGELAWVGAGAVVGAAINMGATYIANGGNVTMRQMGAAAVSGAIAGAVGAMAGPLGGTLARGFGGMSNGLGSAMGAAGMSGAGSAAGQGAANWIDPCNAMSPWKAALWGGLGGGLGKGLFPTKNLNTWSQASHFGPTTFGGLFGSSNAWLNMGSFGTSSGVGAASNF